MSKPGKNVKCWGCRRQMGVNHDPNLYCEDCKAYLEKPECIKCQTPVKTDIPHILCQKCQDQADQAEAEILAEVGDLPW